LAFSAFSQPQKVITSSENEIKDDIKLNVCKNEERLEAVKKLFQKMGAKDTDLKIEKIKDVENLVITKKRQN
jgi:ATP-dependent RNA circularization protein (DNA/RNA ligase family)